MSTLNKRVMRQEKKDNGKIILYTMALYLIGVVFVLSSSSAGLIMNGSENPIVFMQKQLLFGAIALIAGFIIYKINVKFLIDNYKAIFYFTIGILLIVLLIGAEVKGSKSWFKLGGFSIQPAEFAKLTLILMMSTALKHKNVNTPETYKKICLYTLPILGLVVAQGDLGTVMIMGAILLAMMYLGGIQKRILAALTGMGIVAILILSIISPYRMKRMLIFLDPFADYYGMGYQIIQSLYSVANGGLLGRGLGNSVHKFGYLPENHTDFIFSIITEEIGLVGSALVILIFILLVMQIFKVAFRIQNKQLSLICAGIGSFIAIESLLNLSVVVSLMPVTGVTLPFLSYGGSSLISKFICIAIVLGINEIAVKTEARYLDEERIEQAKQRQRMRQNSFEKANNIRKNTVNNIKNFTYTEIKKVSKRYREATHTNKENSKKVTTKFSSEGKRIAKKKDTFIKMKSKLNKNKTKNTLHTKFKSSTSKNKTLKTKGFVKSKDSKFNSINLDETYLDHAGFNTKFEENLTEVDLGSIDIKQFNKKHN